MTEEQKVGGAFDGILLILVNNSGIVYAMKQPLVDFNAAVAATNTATAAWTKAIASFEVALAKYGVHE